jgi:ATP-binding cassette, subfamily B, bacterial
VVDMDTVYVLEKGKLSEQGSHKELLAKKGLYYNLWQDQIGKGKAKLDDGDDE